MKRTKLIRCLPVLGILLGIMLLATSPWVPKLEADPGWRSDTVEGLTYRYTIVPEDDGSYTILTTYSLKTAADIRTATTAMVRVAARFVSEGVPFESDVVFSRPLGADEFRAFVREMGLAPVENTARGVNSGGQVVTLGVPPEWAKDANGRLLIGKPAPGNDPIDPIVLNRLLQGPHSTRFIGVFATSTTMDAHTYKTVVRDSHVYAVDVMKQVLIDVVRSAGISVPIEKIHVVNPPLYPAMETVGIAS